MSQNREAEERLFFDRRRRNHLNEVFWCHMARYAYAHHVACAQAKTQGRPLRVLDAACGTGYGTYFLSRGGHHCTGIDLSGEAIAFCQRVYGRPRCSFQLGSVLELPFDNDSFDLVVSFETIEHLSQEQQTNFLQEIARVLKPDGQVVMSAPVQQGGMNSPEHNHFHQHEPDAAELIDAMERQFSRVQSFGQLLGSTEIQSETDAPTQISPAEGAQNVTVNAAVLLSGILRRARDATRRVVNILFERQYLARPWLLKAVMSILYSGYATRPLNWKQQQATFLILNAQAKPEAQK